MFKLPLKINGVGQQETDSNSFKEIQKAINDGILLHWLRASKYKVLHILHNRPITSGCKNQPGGTEFHVADLIRMIPAAAHWSLSSTGREYCLTAHIPGCEREFYISRWDLDLSSLVNPELFDIIHVHHTSKVDYDKLAESLLHHGRYFVSLHDFRLCCPNINLLTPEGRICNGHECVGSCYRNVNDIKSLRATTRQVLQNALAVFHFCDSTKDWFIKILGGEYPWKLMEHGIQLPEPDNTISAAKDDFLKPSPDAPLKVAFLGVIALNKGAKLIRRLVKRDKLPSGIPIQWHLIGMPSIDLGSALIQHGRYERGELHKIMDSVSPHLVAILSITPETYCFTFDEALACGIPVISTPLGAPAERLRRYQCGWIAERLSADGVLKTLEHVVDNWDEYRAIRRRIPGIPIKNARDIAENYAEIYLAASLGGVRTGTDQLLHAVEQFRTCPMPPPPFSRRLAGHFMNACLSAMDIINVHSVTSKLAKRILPNSVTQKIIEMRQSVF